MENRKAYMLDEKQIEKLLDLFWFDFTKENMKQQRKLLNI